MFDVEALCVALVSTLAYILLAQLKTQARSGSGWIYQLAIFLRLIVPDLCDYLIVPFRPVRLLLRYMGNSSIAREGGPSLMCLSNDILLMIGDELVGIDNNGPTPQKDSWSNLINISMTNRRMRTLYEHSLFRAVTLGRDWDWLQASRGIDSMLRAPHAMSHVRSLTIDFYTGLRKGPEPPSRLPLKLASTLLILAKMAELEKLTLILPDYHTEPFRAAFQKASLYLPTVRSLVLGPHTDWLIAMCPNVTSIATPDSRWLHSNVDGDKKRRHDYSLIRAAGEAKQLQHFELRAWWYQDLLATVLYSMPTLQSLELPRGTLCRGGIQLELPVLAQFPCLRRLVVAEVADLGLGCYGSMALKWPNEDFEEYRGGAQEAAAEAILTHCSHLTELWVGEYAKVVPMRNDDGEVHEVVWSFGQRLETRDRYKPASPVRMAGAGHGADMCTLAITGPYAERLRTREEMERNIADSYALTAQGGSNNVRHLYARTGNRWRDGDCHW